MTTEKQKTNAGAANGASASAGAQALEALMVKRAEYERGVKITVTYEEIAQAMVGLRERIEEAARLVEILYERQLGVKPKRSS